MNVPSSLALAAAVLLGSALTSGCSSTTGEGASVVDVTDEEDFSALTLTDIEGRSFDVCDEKARGVLLIFVSHTCPIANAYVPRIHKAHDEFSGRGIRFFLVQVDPGTPIEQLRTHAQEYELRLPVIHDKNHQLVKRASATVTPQAVLFNRQGQIVYTGRIDDQYVDFGVKRRQPSSHDLVNALGAFLDGREVAPSSTKAVGCYIGDLAPQEPAG